MRPDDPGPGPRVVVLGRPGSGKGTQCALLAPRLGVPHVSTGDLFRAAAERDTPLARMVREYMEAGELVPDDLVVDLVDDEIGVAGVLRGFVLDGFPRTVAQAEQLVELLEPHAIDLAINIVVSAEVARRRLLERLVCCDCGRTTGPASDAARCDDCGGPLTARADDDASTVERRMRLYDAETDALVEWFATRGVLVRVDGDGSPEEVAVRVDEVCARRLPLEGSTVTGHA